MKRVVLRSALTALGLATLVASPLVAQSVLTVAARGGTSVPMGSFRDRPGGERLGGAPAVGLQFALLRGGRTYLYLGFAQSRITCSACPESWVSTDWEAGVQLLLRTGRVVPWLRAGVVSPTVENVPVASEGGGTARYGTSERGWGGEAGAGLRIGLTERVALSPGVRFVAVDLGGAGAEDLRMRYLTIDLGLVLGF